MNENSSTCQLKYGNVKYRNTDTANTYTFPEPSDVKGQN